ncbi:hypothetical protein [Desulfovibrio sp. JC022]|uniref:hypothetical protein n=1 Tax=Desulfovibrio sp. JC022 TaxID=2593642 RepID=UPI0010AA5E89|nr:hypothetical protein [Desulfovibrio sp. JC022]NDV24439.1 hypothetical protein [Desulfovibrio sp. JC022]TIH12077.1 hypothetical protein D0S45_19250 [Marinifilum sp. JC120]
MSRGLNSLFLADLKDGILTPVLERVLKDHTLDFQIRDDEVHIYYRGGQLSSIKPATAKEKYSVSFDKNYLKGSDLDVDLVPEITDAETAELCVSTFQSLKLAMDFHFARQQKNEREFQQLVSRENSYSSLSNKTDYFIVDIEFENKTEDVTTKFDCIAIKWPSVSAARRDPNNNKLKLAIVEIKYGDNALAGKSGLVDHLDKTYNCLRNNGVLENITSTTLKQFNQKRELGLVHFSKNGNQNEITHLPAKPEFIFLFSNHDPSSSTLSNEIDSAAFKVSFEKLQEYADVRFAVSSFMGYGLFEECVLTLDDFKKVLKAQAS